MQVRNIVARTIHVYVASKIYKQTTSTCSITRKSYVTVIKRIFILVFNSSNQIKHHS